MNKLKIQLRATCGNCGYIQVLNGFEDILKVNKNEKMGMLYDGFLLVNEKSCFKCGDDF